MTNAEYRSIIGRLPIKSPTAEVMAALCPHLTTEEAVDALMNSGSVACPPLRVLRGFRILTYYKECVEQINVSRTRDGEIDASVIGTKNHPALLFNGGAGRTRDSYARGRIFGDVFTPYPHMTKAMQFAERHWSDALILDDWVDVVEFFIQDPTDLVNDRYHRNAPRTKAVLHVTLNRDFNEVINDHAKPESELFDDAIAQMTLDRVMWDELKGGRGGHMGFNCAHCGAGLAPSHCTGCGYRFEDVHIRCRWHTPLSRKMVAFLAEHGHTFKVNPEIAWEKERRQ